MPHLWINEPHFTLLVICFSAMFEFGGGYSLAEHAPHFNQVVLLLSTNEQHFAFSFFTESAYKTSEWLRLTLTLCDRLRSNLETRNRTDSLPLEAFALPPKSRRERWRWILQRFGRSLNLKAIAECTHRRRSNHRS